MPDGVARFSAALARTPVGTVRRYAVAWAYLIGYILFQVVYVLLTPHGQATLTAWASTNVVNLEHDPIGSLVVSAFISGGDYWVWPVLIALALFGLNRAIGGVRTVLVCVAGQVIGTLVSEGIEAYRVNAGSLPAGDRYLTDVGPSYVVMAAAVAALLCHGWLARSLAAVDLAVLVFGGDVFGGLSRLNVAAVGHLTAVVTAAVVVIAWRVRRASQRTLPASGASA